MTSYRNPGPWGAGLGRRLTSMEADGNVYDHETRITDLENNPPAAVGVSNIVVSGSQVTFYLEDGTTFGPYNLPTATFNVRNDWEANTAYSPMDLVYVPSSGLYLVLVAHTSGSEFNPSDTTNYKLIVPTLSPAEIKTVTDTAYEPGPSDAGKFIECSNPSGCVIVLTSAFPANTELHFCQAGSGALSWTIGDTGGAILGRQGRDNATDAQGAVVTAKHRGSGVWRIFGDLAQATA